MKILLIGDFSGFHENLKEGLLELGHSVNLVTSGDGYKKISETDLTYPLDGSGIRLKLKMLYFYLKYIKNYYDNDIVQLIGPIPFGSTKLNYNFEIIRRIKNHSGKMFLSSCGTNYFTYKIKDLLRYNYIDATITTDLKGINPFIQKNYIKNNVDVANIVDGIIPTMYTYKLAYNDHINILNTIPFPINVDKIKFIPQKIENNKVKIFHGITREGFKGTKYIREAMEKLKENYPNDVEIKIDGKMPLKEYLKVMEETNIVVDQALSYEYGMNAVYAMAMGKVVLSGNEPECRNDFGRSDLPIINIEPSARDIYYKLEKLVLDKKSVIEIGIKSRMFAEDFHHHLKVAQQYIDTWNSVEEKK